MVQFIHVYLEVCLAVGITPGSRSSRIEAKRSFQDKIQIESGSWNLQCFEEK